MSGIEQVICQGSAGRIAFGGDVQCGNSKFKTRERSECHVLGPDTVAVCFGETGSTRQLGEYAAGSRQHRLVDRDNAAGNDY